VIGKGFQAGSQCLRKAVMKDVCVCGEEVMVILVNYEKAEQFKPPMPASYNNLLPETALGQMNSPRLMPHKFELRTMLVTLMPLCCSSMLK